LTIVPILATVEPHISLCASATTMHSRSSLRKAHSASKTTTHPTEAACESLWTSRALELRTTKTCLLRPQEATKQRYQQTDDELKIGGGQGSSLMGDLELSMVENVRMPRLSFVSRCLRMKLIHFLKLVPRGNGPKNTRIMAERVHIASTARSLAHLLGLLHTESVMHSYRKSHSLLLMCWRGN
jgi:hypothetical protein